MNKAILTGRLGEDPELKHTKSGKAVTRFSMATSEFAGGEKKAEWHTVVVWEQKAEYVCNYGYKGREIAVEGRLQTREWEAESVKRKATEIIAWDVELFGPPEKPVKQEKPQEEDPLPF